MKILLLGASGMAGHVINRYFSDKSDLTAVYSPRSNEKLKVDIFDVDKLKDIICQVSPEYVINCVGLLVKDSEERPDKAAFINGYLPHYLAQLGKENNFSLIHLSTDCVFSGRQGPYVEAAIKDEVKPYGLSKSLGEVVYGNNLTIRTSIIGPEIKSGTGLWQWYSKQENVVNGYTNVYWNGITTLELAKFIEYAIASKITGLAHVTCKNPVSKFELLNYLKMAKVGEAVIQKSRLISSYGSINKVLVNTRNDFSYKTKDIKKLIKEMVEWIKK